MLRRIIVICFLMSACINKMPEENLVIKDFYENNLNHIVQYDSLNFTGYYSNNKKESTEAVIEVIKGENKYNFVMTYLKENDKWIYTGKYYVDSSIMKY